MDLQETNYKIESRTPSCSHIKSSLLYLNLGCFCFCLKQQIGKNDNIQELELFVLHNMVKNAQHLNAFVSANDEQTRVLLGNQQVHEIAIGKTKDLEKNMARLHILKSRLFNGENGTEVEVLAKGKIEHAKVDTK